MRSGDTPQQINDHLAGVAAARLMREPLGEKGAPPMFCSSPLVPQFASRQCCRAFALLFASAALGLGACEQIRTPGFEQLRPPDANSRTATVGQYALDIVPAFVEHMAARAEHLRLPQVEARLVEEVLIDRFAESLRFRKPH